jgi:methylmalonyl-CoA epimerase
MAVTPLRITRVDHIGIAVKDMAAARTALEALGLQVESAVEWPEHHASTAMYPAGDTGLELIHGTYETPFVGEWLGSGAGFFHVCLEVDDIRAAMKELQSRGIGLLQEEPFPGHDGRDIVFVDPASTAGLLFELVQSPAS